MKHQPNKRPGSDDGGIVRQEKTAMNETNDRHNDDGLRRGRGKSMVRQASSMKRGLLGLAACVALAAAADVAAAREPVECVAAARMDSRNAAPGRGEGPFGDYWWANRFLSRIEQVRALKGQTVDVVMLGDSIMHFWEWRHPASWAAFTAGRRVLNCGYGGDGTQHVLWRIAHGELDGYTARNVVLMIGTNNNSAKSARPEDVAKGVEKIVAQVRVRQPRARIILHPIFPRGASAQSVRHAAARARNDETNRLLKRFADAHPEIVWVDINAQLVDETGWVPRALMADEIHPTDAGYDIWMKALAPFL